VTEGGPTTFRTSRGGRGPNCWKASGVLRPLRLLKEKADEVITQLMERDGSLSPGRSLGTRMSGRRLRGFPARLRDEAAPEGNQGRRNGLALLWLRTSEGA